MCITWRVHNLFWSNFSYGNHNKTSTGIAEQGSLAMSSVVICWNNEVVALSESHEIWYREEDHMVEGFEENLLSWIC